VSEKISYELKKILIQHLLEVKCDVFIGNLSSSMRRSLCDLIQKDVEICQKTRSVTIIWNYKNEQKFKIKRYGNGRKLKKIIDLDGILLFAK